MANPMRFASCFVNITYDRWGHSGLDSADKYRGTRLTGYPCDKVIELLQEEQANRPLMTNWEAHVVVEITNQRSEEFTFQFPAYSPETAEERIKSIMEKLH